MKFEKVEDSAEKCPECVLGYLVFETMRPNLLKEIIREEINYTLLTESIYKCNICKARFKSMGD